MIQIQAVDTVEVEIVEVAVMDTIVDMVESLLLKHLEVVVVVGRWNKDRIVLPMVHFDIVEQFDKVYKRPYYLVLGP